jgi:nitrate/TMAO reductase-like tetraheme cytochrome c subunit
MLKYDLVLLCQCMPSDADDTSPETRIVPSEDLNTKQMRISGERLPEVLLEMCDTCHWSLICFNRRGVLAKCPECGAKPSLIPMNIDEVCSIEYDKNSVTIRFDRKNPMR